MGGGNKGKVLFGKRREEKQIHQRAAAVSLSLPWAKRKENQQLVITRKKGGKVCVSFPQKHPPSIPPFFEETCPYGPLLGKRRFFVCVCSGAIGGG